MAGKTLILEGLTADLDNQIKSKLALYFQIKRRSGGEISELRADPTDKRRVVLVYVNEKDRNEVLSRKTHQVDLKGSLGVVTLHVTLPEDVKPEPVLSSEADFVCNDEAKEDVALLRVTSERCRESLEGSFKQCIRDPIVRKHGKNTWILQMSNKADMESVCASNPQQCGIPVEVYKEKEEDDLVDRRRFVLSGLDDCCPSDTISMYIHSCSQRAEHSWEAVGGDSIVVTFKEDIDGHQFMQKTFTEKFNNKKIEACRLELTKSVIVQGDMSQISEEFLILYFSRKWRSGGDIIKSFIHLNQKKSIVITFGDWKVAQRVAERKHTVMEKELVAQLFYPDLQWVLTGQTHHQSKFSTDIAVSVTPDLLSFISRNEILRGELTSALQRVHAMVSLNIISKHPQLELKMSMNKYSLGHLRHGPSWETNARREVQTILEKYIVEHIPMEAEVWQAVKGSCPEVNVATALISFKFCSSELVVVGRWEEVETLVKTIKIKMEKARVELHVVNNTIEKEIELDSKEMLDLTLDLVREDLVNVELSKKDEYLTIHLKGLSEKVQMAETLIQKVQDTWTSKKIDSSRNLIQFLQSLDLQKFQNDHFSLDNIVAVVICTKQFVTVLAKKGDIDRAEKKLKKVIKQEALSISGEYNKESFEEQWKTFHADLKKELESTQNSQNVLIEFSGDKIELCGFSSVVDDVIAKVKACLENKKVVTEDVPLQTLQEVEFVESFMKLSADLLLKALGVTILPCRSPQSPCLKVTATSDQIKEAIDVVNRHIRTITTRKYMYSKAGEAKILKNNKSLLKMEAKSLGFYLELSASLNASQTLALSSLQVSNTIAKISAPQGGSVAPTQQPSMCLASACRDVSFPKVEVEVLGCCSSDLANVKKLVDDLVTKEWKLHQISSPYLALLLPSEKQAIVALSRSLQVCVSVLAPDKATVSGKEADALNMVLKIEKDLQKAKERVTRQEEEKRLWKTVRWEVCAGEVWAELDPSVSLDLEHALHKKEPSIRYTLQNQTYTVNLDKMERTGRNRTTARIKRTLKAGSEITVIEPPTNWDRMDYKTLEIVDLSPTSEQYKKVHANFLQTSKATSATFTVVKIQRIQNKDQWQRYAVKKQMLDKKYPQNTNEIDLYHGTTAVICQKVNSNGFNRSFCGRNATQYGNGTYFAKQSWYSCNDTYSNPDAQGLKYMYQARVLVGKPCLGTRGMVEPAPLDPKNPLSGLHDCAVNNVRNPFIYVVFSDAGAYPDYLISFKAS